MAKAERVIIEKKFLKDIFRKEFLDIIQKVGGNVFPISVILLNEVVNEKSKMAFPIVINHQNKEEVNNGILHIESPNTDLVDKLSKLMEGN
jgi:hypothetical protein